MTENGLFGGAGAIGNAVTGTLSHLVITAVRQVMNSAVRNVTPDQLSQAIRENISLWTIGGNNIQQIKDLIPSRMIAAGRPLYRKALADYGNSTKLVLAWLRQDNPVLYSGIIQADGGTDWFDRQVREICENVGLDYEL